MQLRDQKHAAGQPFSINSDLLSSGQCIYEYADGGMKLVTSKDGGVLITDDLPENVRQDALNNLELAMKLAKPDCYNCAFKQKIPGSAHIACNSSTAKVEGDPNGIYNGWFFYPYNFDPTWLRDCSGYLPNELVEKVKKRRRMNKTQLSEWFKTVALLFTNSSTPFDDPDWHHRKINDLADAIDNNKSSAEDLLRDYNIELYNQIIDKVNEIETEKRNKLRLAQKEMLSIHPELN